MSVMVIHPTKRGLLGAKVVVGLIWAWAVLSWTPTLLLLAPLVLALGWLLYTMRRAGMALRWFISIPEAWAHTEHETYMVDHEMEHIRRQREMGMVRFVLRWLTARGCVEFEAEGFAHDVTMYMRRRGDDTALRKTWERHYAGAIKRRYRQVRRSSWTITQIEVVLAERVSKLWPNRRRL